MSSIIDASQPPVQVQRGTPPAGWEHLSPEVLEPMGVMAAMVFGGLSICPLVCDGKKSPALWKWKHLQARFPFPLEILSWNRQGFGYAIICGKISGGLEVIDFDDGELYPQWYGRCSEIIESRRLPIVATPSRGYHIYYRCQEISGNLKLAKSKAGETLIETRGEGGYLAGPNNPRAVHKTGRLYLQIGGVDLPAVPTIEPSERKQLLQAAISLDEFGIRKALIEERAKQLRNQAYKAKLSDGGATITGLPAWDDFKAKATWAEVLEPHGWSFAGQTFWTRPGGDPGAHSASINKAADGTSVLAVFSSNAGPLAPTTGDHATHDLFQAYALLNFNGNRTDAARELRRKGYGG